MRGVGARWWSLVAAWLPASWCQQRLWHAAALGQPAAVLRWLRAGADPNRASYHRRLLFNTHIPVRAAVTCAVSQGWQGPSLVSLRLLLRAGGNLDVCSENGRVTAEGVNHLTAGVPNWLLLRCGAAQPALLVEDLLSRWAWRPHRANAQQLSRLLRLRARLSEQPMSPQTLTHLFWHAPTSVLDQAVALFSPLGPGAMAGLLYGKRPELLPLFSGQEVDWVQVGQLCKDVSLLHEPEFRRQHAALREQAQLEASTALVSRAARVPHRL